jgi:hypothetical protein
VVIFALSYKRLEINAPALSDPTTRLPSLLRHEELVCFLLESPNRKSVEYFVLDWSEIRHRKIVKNKTTMKTDPDRPPDWW